MVAERLRVIMEFSKSREKDLILYQELIKYSNPGAIAKDMLYGVIPLPKLNNEEWMKIGTCPYTTFVRTSTLKRSEIANYFWIE